MQGLRLMASGLDLPVYDTVQGIRLRVCGIGFKAKGFSVRAYAGLLTQDLVLQAECISFKG